MKKPKGVIHLKKNRIKVEFFVQDDVKYYKVLERDNSFAWLPKHRIPAGLGTLGESGYYEERCGW